MRIRNNTPAQQVAADTPEPKFEITFVAITINCALAEQKALPITLMKLHKSRTFNIRPIEIKACTYRKVYEVTFVNGSNLHIYLEPISRTQRYLKLEWKPYRVDPDIIAEFFSALLGDGANSILKNANVARFKFVMITENFEPGMLVYKQNIKVSEIQSDKRDEFVVKHIIGSANSNYHISISSKFSKCDKTKSGSRIAKYKVIHDFTNMDCSLLDVLGRLRCEMNKLEWFTPDLLQDEDISPKLFKNITNNGITHAINTKNKADRDELLYRFNLLYKASPILITKKQLQVKFRELFLFLKS
jgi:hypothetical protein